MSGFDDPPDEILDLGRQRRHETANSPRSLPPLHIGAQPPDDDDGSDRPSWWHWGTLAAAVAAGLVTGVLGSNARHDAADLAAAESAVHIVAGAPGVFNAAGGPAGSPTGNTAIQVPFLNAGPLEVELLWVRPQGWRIADDAVRRTTRLPPDTWVTVRVRAVPDCAELVSPDVLEVRVRTQARESLVTVPLPVPGAMQEALLSACRSLNPIGVGVEDVEVLGRPTPGTLTMRLFVRAVDPSLGFQLIDVSASAPGFRLVGAALPVAFEPGGRSPSRLDLTWEIVACEVTQTLGDIELGLEFADDRGRIQTGSTSLPGRGIAELARFGLETCGAGS